MTTKVKSALSEQISIELLKKLKETNLNDELAKKVINSKDNSLAKKIVELIQNEFEPTTSQEKAQQIMGQNFFGIEDAIKYFGIKPTEEELKTLSEIPYSEEVLEKCKNTHVLVAIFPISILEIRGKVNSKLFYKQDWYDGQEFAKEKGKTCWKLIRKTPVYNSTSKTWKEQLELINKDEEIPTAQQMTYLIIGYYLKNGERLFGNVYVRTSSTDSDGSLVLVGHFDSDGLVVNGLWDDYRHSSLGVSVARKS